MVVGVDLSPSTVPSSTRPNAVTQRKVIDLTLERRTTVSRLTVSTQVLTTEHVETTNPVDYEFAVRSDMHYLALHDLMFHDALMRVEGEKHRRGRDLRETLTFFPAGTGVEGWCKPCDRRQAFTALYIDPNAVPETVASQPFWQRPDIYFKSPELLRTLTQLKEVLQGSLPFKEVLLDALGQVAIAQFANRQIGLRTNHPVERKLHETELRRVERYMLENVAGDVQLEDLAGVIGMSKFHFIRCYRSTTGRTPYRSLLDLRCETAAKELKAGRSAAEAAAAAGFEGTAQLSRSLRATRGVTARDIRS